MDEEGWVVLQPSQSHVESECTVANPCSCSTGGPWLETIALEKESIPVEALFSWLKCHS